MTYVKRYGKDGEVEIYRVEPGGFERFWRAADGHVQADAWIRRDELLTELSILRDSLRAHHPKRFWKAATHRLRWERFPKHVKYVLKRQALGHRLRDSVDPKQLDLRFG